MSEQTITLHQNPNLIFNEAKEPVNFVQFREAFKVFAGDYNIVKHPDTPVGNPFSEPNPPSHGHRQYTMTQIPDDMQEEEFLRELAERDTVFVSCMDRDAVGPAYQALKKQGKNIFLVSMAGGITQDTLTTSHETETQKRLNALRTIMEYLSRHQENIGEVIATNHDTNCGYITYSYDGTTLAEFYNTTPGSHVEQEATRSLIQTNVGELELNKLFPGKVKMALVKIDRTAPGTGLAGMEYFTQ